MAGPLRWEWRTFGEGVKPAEGRFAALSPDAVQESDERYVLSLRNGDTVKVRDKLLDVKRLVRVNDDGLEQWEPALKAEFPVAADLVRSVVDGLHAAVPALERSAYTEDELFGEVVGPSSDLVAVDVHKTRRRFTIGGCSAELTDVRADRAETRTIAVESEDPERVTAVVGELGLGSLANVSVPRGLAALLGFGARRYAVVDVGTNSVKFHVGERQADGSWRTIVDRAEVTRLGEGLEASGRLGAEPMERTADAIVAMADEARADGAEAVAAVGTAGLRIAANSDEFLDAVRARCGVEIEVISGEEEARLAYRAATSALGPRGGSLAVFDTGGGSSQFTFGRAGPDRRAVQRQRRGGALHGAVRARRRRLGRDAPQGGRGDRSRPRTPRWPGGAGHRRRDGRRQHEPRRSPARAGGIRPGGRAGHEARA